ncbi:MAG: quinolinate synthase NadA [Desulfamplus sp.]|nr:quinolinate synthase NadA [Desulfamplus sp.]
MNTFYQEIKRIKEELGNNIVIPAHHYQRDEIVDFADFIGDSYKLALDCSKTDARYIVFCGVHFMAEGASVLAGHNQIVIAPDTGAGCPMADMIKTEDAGKAYDLLTRECPREIVPVVYMNSSAEMKAFCGARKGTVCTSSNAARIVKSFLDEGRSVLFSPDFNLGVNTANELGLAREEIALLNPNGTLKEGYPARAKMFLWPGFCYVHQCFSIEDITYLRKEYPDIRIIVHPECREEVVNAADHAGSTSMIYNTVRDSPPGTVWAIGTEYSFVNRMAWEFKEKTVVPLKKSLCTDMNRTTLEKLFNVMVSVERHFKGKGELYNVITVPESLRKDAGDALGRMMDIVENKVT